MAACEMLLLGRHAHQLSRLEIHSQTPIDPLCGWYLVQLVLLSGHISSPTTLSATPGCYLGKEHPGIYEVCPRVYDVSCPFFLLSLVIPLFLL